MSSDSPTTTGDASSATEHDDTTAGQTTESFPSLRIQADGPATRRRVLTDTDQTSCTETSTVQLSLTHELASIDEWNQLIGTAFHDYRQKGRLGSLIDRLLAELTGDVAYLRPSSNFSDAPEWTVTIVGPAPAWKRFVMDHLGRDDREPSDRAYEAVGTLKQLLEADLASTGAALAALDIISEYDVKQSTEPFLNHVECDAESE